MIRLTPSATDSAVKALATARPRRYLTATVRVVMGSSDHSGLPRD